MPTPKSTVSAPAPLDHQRRRHEASGTLPVVITPMALTNLFSQVEIVGGEENQGYSKGEAFL